MEAEMLSVVRDGKPVLLVVMPRASLTDDIPPHAIAGEVDVVERQPDWSTFRRNSAFVDFVGRYMRGELPIRPDIIREAKVKPRDYVYVIDQRTPDPQGDVPFFDIVGWYRSGGDGRVEPETFEYNGDHLLVAGPGLVSGLFSDERLRKAVLIYRPS